MNDVIIEGSILHPRLILIGGWPDEVLKQGETFAVFDGTVTFTKPPGPAGALS